MSKMNLTVARVGVVAEMMETGKKFVLTSLADDKSSGVMTELLTDEDIEAGVTPQVIDITLNNQVMFRFVEDPNPQDTPTASLGREFVVNGNPVETGELDINAILQTVPGGVLVLTAKKDDRYDLLLYNVKQDKFRRVLSNMARPAVKELEGGYIILTYDKFFTEDVKDEDGNITRTATICDEAAVYLLKDGEVVSSRDTSLPLGTLEDVLDGMNNSVILLFNSDLTLATSDDALSYEVEPFANGQTRLTKVVIGVDTDEEESVRMYIDGMTSYEVEADIQTVTVARGNRLLVKTANTVFYSNDGNRPKTITSKVAAKNEKMMGDLEGYDILTNYTSSDGRVTLYLRNENYEVKTLTSAQTDKGIVLTVGLPEAE